MEGDKDLSVPRCPFARCLRHHRSEPMSVCTRCRGGGRTGFSLLQRLLDARPWPAINPCPPRLAQSIMNCVTVLIGTDLLISSPLSTQSIIPRSEELKSLGRDPAAAAG